MSAIQVQAVLFRFQLLLCMYEKQWTTFNTGEFRPSAENPSQFSFKRKITNWIDAF